MLAKPVHRDEQINLIMGCRQSGLTDFEWCRQHNINVGTFYNWVKRLKHTEGITFPRGAKIDYSISGTVTSEEYEKIIEVKKLEK